MTAKQKKINRWNVYQRELSEYVKEQNLSKSDYKRFKALYKQLGGDVPIKRIREAIPPLIAKFGQVQKVELPSEYTSRFPFYGAKSEFSLPKYFDKILTVKFNDGGLRLDWLGTSNEFMSWFSGDVIAYFRNNYNDSPVAEFVLKSVDGNNFEYEIVVDSSAFGADSYVPPDKGIVVKDKPQRDKESRSLDIEFTKQKAELIKQMKGIYTNEEIRMEIDKLNASYYGKKNK